MDTPLPSEITNVIISSSCLPTHLVHSSLSLNVLAPSSGGYIVKHCSYLFHLPATCLDSFSSSAAINGSSLPEYFLCVFYSLVPCVVHNGRQKRINCGWCMCESFDAIAIPKQSLGSRQAERSGVG